MTAPHTHAKNSDEEPLCTDTMLAMIREKIQQLESLEESMNESKPTYCMYKEEEVFRRMPFLTVTIGEKKICSIFS